MNRRARHLLDFAHHVETNAEGCPDDSPYGVVDDDTGAVVGDGCYATRDEADTAVAQLDSATDATTEVRMFAVIAVEGFETSDGRVLDVGGWNQDSVRMLPLPAWVLDEQSPWGHEGAWIAGRWETMERMADGRRIYAEGALSTVGERGQFAVDQIRNQNLRFVSIDVGDADVEYEVRQVDEDGWPIDVLAHFTNYELMGATVVGQPAIAWAVVWLDGMEPPAEFTATLPAVLDRVDEPEVVESGGGGLLILAGATANAEPPREWFERTDEHESLVARVHDTGRAPHVVVSPADLDGLHHVYGYIAPWGVCHTGLPGCVTAPHSASEYSYFATASTGVACCAACGQTDHDASAHAGNDSTTEAFNAALSVGLLTMGTTHADLGMTPTRARLHYEDTGTQVARIAVGEDDYGIWFAGTTIRSLADARLELLDGSNVSGDWRLLRNSLELIASLVVNVPGFPMVLPQAHIAASGIQTALIGPLWPGVDAIAASGRRTREDPRWDLMHSRLRALESEVHVLRPLAAEELARRVHPIDV